MGGLVFAAWIVILFFLKVLFKKELAEKPADVDFSDQEVIVDPKTRARFANPFFVGPTATTDSARESIAHI